tara:strand:+ start:11484 stop:13640 length:2157 start_codon:yes stop_codon:yes gene_type:complete
MSKMKTTKGQAMRKLSLLTATAIGISIQAGHATETDDQQEVAELEEIVVVASGSRLPASLSSFPGSVSIVKLEDLETQRGLSTDMGTILGYAVPGLGTSTFTANNRSTTLRGRKPAILIDGVPIDTPLRAGDQALRAVDSSALQSVEIVRGSNALYGSGGAGGSINYVTKDPGEGPTQYFTEVGAGMSLTHTSDSFTPSVRQSIVGGDGQFGYVFTGYWQEYRGFYDAEGDRIPPKASGSASIGLPYSTILSGLGKVSYNWGEQKLAFSALYYSQSQEDKFATVPGDVLTRQKATAREAEPFPGTEEPGTENVVLNLVYNHDDILGGSFRSQVYYQDYMNIFGGLDLGPGVFAGEDGIFQSTIDSEKYGLRLDFNTPLEAIGGVLLWGGDFAHDTTGQPLEDDRIWTPFLDLNQYAAFAQLETSFQDNLTIRGGLRYERSTVSMDDFTTIFGGFIEGGSIDFDAVVFNAGLVFKVTEDVEVFGGFSQGYSVAEIGRILRNENTDTTLERIDPQAIKNNSFEAGLRFDREQVQASFVVYLSTSSLGLQLTATEDENVLAPEQFDERIWGIEGTIDLQPAEHWSLGGTLSWLEGKRDTDDDGKVDEYLTGQRIPPLKATAYVEYGFAPDWKARLQGIHSGNRNRFPDSVGTGRQFEGPIEAYTTIDLLVTGQVGPGVLSLGVQNMLNEDYFTVLSQSFNRNDRLAKAPGTTATIRYGVSY